MYPFNQEKYLEIIYDPALFRKSLDELIALPQELDTDRTKRRIDNDT